MSGIRRPIARALGRLMGRHEEAGPVGLRLRAWMMRFLPGQLTCADFELFVYDYKEGSLSERERQIFDLHMELCPMCRVYFSTYVQTIELGQRICAPDEECDEADLPEDLVTAILASRSVR